MIIVGGDKMAINNPLRYPGAKSKLVPYIQKLIENEGLNGCTLYEPYAGSAAVSFSVLKSETISKAIINELDPLIYCFWISVMEYTEDLIKLIYETDITLENWNTLSLYRNPEYIKNKSTVNIGFAGLFLNRTNFSGILKAGPLGGFEQKSQYKIDCRFNKEKVIESILELSKFRDKIEIYNMDAIEFLKQKTKYKRNNKTFVYIDPPYYEKGPSLYRYYYNQQTHTELSKFIKTKSYPWLISYDDSVEIKKMYRNSKQQHIYLDYSINTHMKAKELLISNLEIPPIENYNSLEKNLIG